MSTSSHIEQTIVFVKETLKGAEGGHDWFHIERVFKNSLLLAKDEKVDTLVVGLAALLHDIADPKFHNGDETIGPRTARKFLETLSIDQKTVDHIVLVIENISFKSSLGNKPSFFSHELAVVQDADRLDAIGAIGVARAFNYGGFKNRGMYDPEIAPNLNMSKEEYKNSQAPTINHFYEKLLLLKDKMNTETGKRIAEKRHQFMRDFLEQFYNEWNGKI
ncbi:uncharacterized protein SAMN04487911_101188 [Arenibacter nanhaiticus]|uniref:HD domain-containing protein n=1 Tax=Arenibacter nanhaiticus TaxID=558155 RepID=A0A1M6AER5_9FLAO|nr:HD domain-containing protein [Arenibacter nanhaiticus]SHI34703.1 uncharacterized protein SAMN04487911_101188 [Arenibacter nanhaiticus]